MKLGYVFYMRNGTILKMEDELQDGATEEDIYKARLDILNDLGVSEFVLKGSLAIRSADCIAVFVDTDWVIYNGLPAVRC